jgi:hypothetical protein
MFIYAKSSGLNDAAIGKLETPIKMLIEHESTLYKKQGGICKWLFNVEKSNKYGETIVTSSDFDTFMATREGAASSIDSIEETAHKFIEHIQFTKEFSITREMMEDANFGIAADAKRRVENFTRAYYKTMDRICETALANGTKDETLFAGAKIDLCTSDGYPLFYSNHYWGTSKNRGEQSNYYKTNFCLDENEEFYSAEMLNKRLFDFSVKLRNMRDENGDVLGYNADTVVIPGNRPNLEATLKKVCGSEYAPGTANNDINIHYGRWNIIIMPHWETRCDEMMIMSSDANQTLGGNMFFNRVPLTVTNWVENHTGNYIWNGRCRFGIGFGTYKHIIRVTYDTEAQGATEI